MSKQSDAKKLQGYDPKPILQICENCKYFEYDTVFVFEYLGKKHFKHKNLRGKCSIGDFAVQKIATCKQYREKDLP